MPVTSESTMAKKSSRPEPNVVSVKVAADVYRQASMVGRYRGEKVGAVISRLARGPIQQELRAILDDVGARADD